MKSRSRRSSEDISPLKAAGYVRVSTEEQKIEGNSIRSQRTRITQYAKSQGWELAGFYADEGYSGKDLKRPGLKSLIADIEKGIFNTVLVYRVDRITRKQKDLWFLLEDVFEASEIGFKSVIEPFDTTTAQGKAFLGMLAVFAQLERDTIAERTRDSLHNKRQNNEWVGRVPIGYKLSSRGNLVKDRKAMDLIARAKRLRREGKSYRDIGRRLGVSHTTVFNLVNNDMRALNKKYINKL